LLSLTHCIFCCETAINYAPGDLAAAASFTRGGGVVGGKHIEDITVNILSDNESWTFVNCKKQKQKDSKNDRLTKQQKLNFEHYGNIWYEEPYKSYWRVSALSAEPVLVGFYGVGQFSSCFD
jgi:hypothetical protein